jgi:hypothetical protein
VFTARYALSPYIKQIRFVFKGLMTLSQIETAWHVITERLSIRKRKNMEQESSGLVLRHCLGILLQESRKTKKYSARLVHVPRTSRMQVKHDGATAFNDVSLFGRMKRHTGKPKSRLQLNLWTSERDISDGIVIWLRAKQPRYRGLIPCRGNGFLPDRKQGAPMLFPEVRRLGPEADYSRLVVSLRVNGDSFPLPRMPV